MMRLRLTLVLVGLLAVTTDVAAAPPAAPSDAARADAKNRFEAGVELLEARSFDAALVEFLRSHELFPTRGALENAAVCLRELGRLDEAFEMFNRVLAEFPDMSPEVRQRIEEQRVSLEARLGALLVEGEPGATVSVDGRPRGTLPLPAPLRLTAGPRTVRVHLEGYVPLVQTVEIAPQKTRVMKPSLEVLARAGRLRVSEKNGRADRVIVDGVTVGTTPWEGALAPGDHAVWLEGAWGDGTVPKSTRVLVGQRAQMVLESTELPAIGAIRVTPPEATIAIDGVVVGSGSWEGRLGLGKVEIVVSAPGYVTEVREMTLSSGGRTDLRVDLTAAAPVEAPGPPSSWELGARAGVALSPTVAAAECASPCGSSVGLGPDLGVSLVLRFPFGLGVGVDVGWLRIAQSLDSRALAAAAPGRAAQSLSLDDSVRVHGVSATIVASYRFGDSPFLTFGVGAGGFVGALRDQRGVASVDAAGGAYEVGPYFASGTVFAPLVTPAVRGGLVLGAVELWLGATGMFMFPVVAPEWDYERSIPAGGDGALRLPTEPLVSPVVFAATPALGASVVF